EILQRARRAPSVAAALAPAAQYDVVLGDVERHRSGHLRQRFLEARILERDHAPAVPADRVMVVMAGGIDALEASRAAADLDPLDQPELLQLLQRAVDAGAADRRLAAPQLVVEVEGGDRAVVLGERLDHRRTRPAAAVARV